jgi:hypothetical protein
MNFNVPAFKIFFYTKKITGTFSCSPGSESRPKNYGSGSDPKGSDPTGYGTLGMTIVSGDLLAHTANEALATKPREISEPTKKNKNKTSLINAVYSCLLAKGDDNAILRHI